MGRSWLAWLPALAGVALAAALLVPTPDPVALEQQGLIHLLAAPDARGQTLLRELEAAGHGGGALRARVGRESWRRALASALGTANAERAARGLPPYVLVPADDPAPLLDLRLVADGGGLLLEATLEHDGTVRALARRGPWTPPGREALLPPLVAILVALSLRRTVSALFCGIWLGAATLRFGDGAGVAGAAVFGLWDVFWVYFRGELFDTFRIEIIGFVVALLAMVGIMSRSGGVQGLVDRILRFAGTVRSTLAVSFGMGCLMFFDDYSNCLIVGTTMRPLTDRLRISREKLAWVVDSTAAPIAGLSLLSTWIAFEVSTFAPHLPAAGITENPYAVFLQSLPFRFYSLFTLGFVLINVLVGRDFGPMRAAEARARSTGQVVRAGGTPLVSDELTAIEARPDLPHRARNALLPIATVIAVTLQEIFRGGGGYEMLATDPARLASLPGLTDLLFAGGGGGPLFAGSAAGLLVAIFLAGSNATRLALLSGAIAAPLVVSALPVKIAGYTAFAAALAGVTALAGVLLRGLGLPTRRSVLRARELLSAGFSSTRALSFAIVILFEAWMIGQVCQDVNTADYLVALSAGAVTAVWLPVLLFGLACLVSFATGTSWGTMSILLPNVVGLAAAVGAEHPIGAYGLVLVCIGAVLEGSIFGDHCSPISDTTVLSSIATASDHIDHVRTQAPYALVAAGMAVVAGYLPTLVLEGWSLPLALVTGLGAWTALLWLLGRPAE